MSRPSLWICAILLLPMPVGAQEPPAPAEPRLEISVVEGDGAINSIRLKRARNPVARVTDATGEPIEGATVTFLLPATGPGGMFQNNGLSYTTQTDAKGIAASKGLTPNRTAGDFRIRVVASAKGETASANLRQTNTEPVADSGRRNKFLLLGVIAGGVAGAVVAATSGGGSSAGGGSTGGTLSGAVTAGAPSLGPPQ